MVPGRGLAPVVLVALISFVAGCSGSPGTTGSPAPTPAGTMPIAEPSTTAIGGVATPKATQPGWRVAGTVEGGGTLVAFDAGYVITGIGREVSFSPDGHDWQLVVLPWTTGRSNGVEMDARIITIGAAGRYAVAVGYADKKPCEPSSGDGGPPPCGRRPVSWVTENGIDWVASEADDIAVEAFSYQGFERIWPVDGGWDAALGQELILPDASALAHSDDGLHWRALAPVPGSATGDAPAEHVGGVGSTDGRRIIWTFDEADKIGALLRRPDVARPPGRWPGSHDHREPRPVCAGPAVAHWRLQVGRGRIAAPVGLGRRHRVRGGHAPACIRDGRRDQVVGAMAGAVSGARRRRQQTGGNLVECRRRGMGPGTSDDGGLAVHRTAGRCSVEPGSGRRVRSGWGRSRWPNPSAARVIPGFLRSTAYDLRAGCSR